MLLFFSFVDELMGTGVAPIVSQASEDLTDTLWFFDSWALWPGLGIASEGLTDMT